MFSRTGLYVVHRHSPPNGSQRPLDGRSIRLTFFVFVGYGCGVAFRYAGSSPDGVGVEPGPTVGEGFGSDGLIGVAVGEGNGVGSDGSIGVGVILGSVIVGDGIGVTVGVGFAAEFGSVETVVAIKPEIKNKKIAITKSVFLNIIPPCYIASQ